MKAWGLMLTGWMVVAAGCAAWAQESLEKSETDSGPLYASSLEELMKMKITTPSKRPEAVLDTPSAIYVITAEDIRRSGVTATPDALRLAPGVTVSRMDLSRWAVSMRGFHGQYVENLLVMIDGRSVYTPTFSGTIWELQDVMLDDVDRIEVVRGPGASTWGANAVNGVINIITKSSADTQGGLVSVGGGTTERLFGSVRYGGSLNEHTTYRVYVKGFDREGFVDDQGNSTDTSWDAGRTGFRMDGEPTAWDSWSLQGDLYDNDSNIAAKPSVAAANAKALTYQDVESNGGNLLGKWNHVFSDTSVLRVQTYYDHVTRDQLPALKEEQNTFDIDAQHEFALTENQQLVWGGGYRYLHDNIENGQFVMVNPEARGMNLYSAFVQDNISLMDDRLIVTVGTKYENHEYTGSEWLPDARVLYKLTDRQSAWASVSRAVRTPSRLDYEGRYLLDVDIENQQPVYLMLIGGDDQSSEELIAYEAGYRAMPSDAWTLDLAFYCYEYDKLASAEPGADIPNPAGGSTVRPFYVDNKNKGVGYGGEMAVNWIACDWAAFQATYSIAELDLENTDGGMDTFALLDEEKTPEQQVSLRSMFELARNVELDLWIRYVDAINGLDVPSYWNADVRIGWKIRDNLELAVVGQNLIDDQHPEFKTQFYNGLQTEVERSVYGKVTWTF